MKRILFPICALVLMASCADKNAYTISGSVSEEIENGRKVYLKVLGDDLKERTTIDSTMVEAGTFQFEGIAEANPKLGFVVVAKSEEKRETTAMIIVEAGKIAISTDGDATGAPKNDEFTSLMNVYNNGSDDEAQVAMFDFTKANIGNQLGAFVLLTKSHMLEVEQIKELLPLVQDKYKESVFYNKLAKRVVSLEATSVGKQFTDLKGKDPKGEEVALSDFAGKGKYVLVDFWASWCGPCRKDMPNVVEAYNKYKSKGFEIVGVSLDVDANKWVDCMENLNMTWPQLSDLKGWKSEYAALYGVNGIPHTVLIDKDGKIIARGLHGTQIAEKLAELLD